MFNLQSKIEGLQNLFLKYRVYDVILVFLLAVSFFIKINGLDYPLENLETSRDYLVARHILNYKELPLVGPWNGAFGNTINSPLYYYLLALFLTIKDELLFLGLVNICFQLVTIAVLYIFTKKLFGPGTACIASILFAFSEISRMQSSEIWQPYLMQPFAYISYLLFLFSYLKKKYYLLLLALFTFFFAAALHMSVFSLLPIVILVTLFILRDQGKKIQHYLAVFLISVVALGIFYGSMLVYLNKNSAGLLTSSYITLHGSPLKNLTRNTVILKNAIFANFANIENFPDRANMLNDLLIFILVSCAIIYAVLFRKDRWRRNCLLLLVAAVIQPLFFTAFLSSNIHWHYFTPIFGLVIILITEIIRGVFSQKNILLPAQILIFFIVLRITSSNFDFMNSYAYTGDNYTSIRSVANTIQQEISKIKSEKKFDNNEFFQVRVYGKGEELLTAHIWGSLEKNLGTKFTRIVNSNNNFETTNKREYIFLICQHFNGKEDDEPCKNIFLKDQRVYAIIKKIYAQAPFSMYLTKQDNIQ